MLVLVLVLRGGAGEGDLSSVRWIQPWYRTILASGQGVDPIGARLLGVCFLVFLSAFHVFFPTAAWVVASLGSSPCARITTPESATRPSLVGTCICVCVCVNSSAGATQVIISAQNFEPNSCDEVDGFPEPSWHRVQVGLLSNLRA